MLKKKSFDNLINFYCFISIPSLLPFVLFIFPPLVFSSPSSWLKNFFSPLGVCRYSGLPESIHSLNYFSMSRAFFLLQLFSFLLFSVSPSWFESINRLKNARKKESLVFLAAHNLLKWKQGLKNCSCDNLKWELLLLAFLLSFT